MKKNRFTILGIMAIVFFFSFVLLIFSCSKDNGQDSQNIDNKFTSAFRSASTIPATVEVDCRGSCDKDQPCGALWDVRSGTIHCICDACVMSIDKDNVANRSTASRADMSKIAAHFVDYVQRTHWTGSYLMTHYRQSFCNAFEFIEIEYIVDNNISEKYSVLFVSKFKSSNMRATPEYTILYDCYGSCDQETQSCTEVYNTGTGEVYCSCTGDNCKMRIEKVK